MFLTATECGTDYKDDLIQTYFLISCGLMRQITALRDASLPDTEIKARWALRDNLDWQLAPQRKKLAENPNWQAAVTECLYRPFDLRFCHLG